MNKNVRSLIFLAVGIVIAIVFLLMPTEIYEAVKYFDGGYSNELYNHGLYSMFAMFIVGITWAMNIIYYYIINSVKFLKNSVLRSLAKKVKPLTRIFIMR